MHLAPKKETPVPVYPPRRAATDCTPSPVSRCIPGLAGFFIRLTCYLGRSRSIQLSRSISCDLAAISPIQVPFFFFARCARNLDKTKTRISCTIFRRISCTFFNRGPRQSRRNHCTPSSLCISRSDAFRTSADQPACAPASRRGRPLHSVRNQDTGMLEKNT